VALINKHYPMPVGNTLSFVLVSILILPPTNYVKLSATVHWQDVQECSFKLLHDWTWHWTLDMISDYLKWSILWCNNLPRACTVHSETVISLFPCFKNCISIHIHSLYSWLIGCSWLLCVCLLCKLRLNLVLALYFFLFLTIISSCLYY